MIEIPEPTFTNSNNINHSNSEGAPPSSEEETSSTLATQVPSHEVETKENKPTTTDISPNFQQEETEDFIALQQQCKELLEKIIQDFKRHRFTDFTWAGRIKIALRLSQDIVFKNDSPLTFVKLKPKPDYFMGGIQVFWITWYECLTSWGKPYIIKNTKVAYFDKHGLLKYKADL